MNYYSRYRVFGMYCSYCSYRIGFYFLHKRTLKTFHPHSELSCSKSIVTMSVIINKYLYDYVQYNKT